MKMMQIFNEKNPLLNDAIRTNETVDVRIQGKKPQSVAQTGQPGLPS